MKRHPISFSTFAVEAKVLKTKQEKRRKKVSKLQSRTGDSDELWSGLEGKEYSNPADLNWKAKVTYTEQFLDRLRDLLSTNTEMDSFGSRPASLHHLRRNYWTAMMNIKIDRLNERYLREMIQKNSRYGDMESLVNEAVEQFYQQEKKRRFK